MNRDVKTNIIIHSLGIVVALALLITLLSTGGTVLQYVFASLVMLCFVVGVYLDWSLEKKKNTADSSAPALPAPQSASPAADSELQKQNTIHKLSHHIRTPLSNIVGIANLMSQDYNPDNKKMLVDSLVASVETITDLFDIIDGETSGKLFGIDVNDAVRVFDIRSLITQTAELTPGVEVKVEAYGDLPRLRGNSVKMRRIMMALFDFFLQYTPKDALPVQVSIVINRVRIPITPVKYRFDVRSDFGISIDPDASITELNIAKRLVEDFGGNIKHRFEDESTFIYFNVCFDGVEETLDGTPPQSSSAMEVHTNETAGFTNIFKAKTLNDANIIVCDDNPINQKVMNLSLDKHVKSIALASNGQECVDLVKKESYDLILMDIQMPVLDGYEATRQIRLFEGKWGGHIPIIAVTANTMSGERQHCLEVGMDDYVSKPFQIEDVLRIMSEQLVKMHT